jgi:hypothetical protein
MLNVYDTSTLTPVLRKEYPVAVDITTSYFTNITAEEFLRYEEEEAAEAIRQVLAASLADVSHAIR